MMEKLPPHRRTETFSRVVIALGAAACVASIAFQYYRPVAPLDVRFLLLAALTVGVGSRVSVKIPVVKGEITVSDTLIFLVILLYGGDTAVPLYAAEAFVSSLRFSKRWVTVFFNAGMIACSTFVTVWTLRLLFGSVTDLTAGGYSATFVLMILVMALVQYAANAGIAAVWSALWTNRSVLFTWSNGYLWTSISYFAGASGAAITAVLMGSVGVYALFVVLPVAGIVYFTYRTYLQAFEASQREAEQAQRHVEELNHYIEEQQRTQEQLHFAAFHDALTGLPNRELLSARLAIAFEEAKHRSRDGFAVLFIDLDRFKLINDSLGHPFGDLLLVQIARRLERCVRGDDTVARLGGDEFAIILDDVDGELSPIMVADRIRDQLALPFNLDGHEVYTSASVGISHFTPDYDSPDDVLRDADTAMYRAKTNGKARHVIFDKEMHTRATALLKLENDLRRAVEREEIRAHYQPIVSLEDGRTVGFEALARWSHPERGCVMPAEFIPIAEETGLIVRLGEQILRQACVQTRAWQTQIPFGEKLVVSVNLSARQLAQPDLTERIEAILLETGLPHECLQLEVTESAVMENPDIASETLAKLKALGIDLGIDDFGVGYSSLSYLHRFPFTNLKIDRSFVSQMATDSESSKIVRTIVALATELRLDVTAEGVETDAQREQLAMTGCQYVQGFLFSEALEPVDVAGLLYENAARQELDVYEWARTQTA